MGKEIKIYPGKRQLTLEEMRVLKDGLEMRTTNIFGIPKRRISAKFLMGRKDKIRIIIESENVPLSSSFPLGDFLLDIFGFKREIYIYNSTGYLIKKAVYKTGKNPRVTNFT